MAIEIPQETKSNIREYISLLRGNFKEFRVGWVPADKLHLTIKFLGETDERQIAVLFEAVQRTGEQISDFKFQISGTGVFPNRKRARILWLGLEDCGENVKKLFEVLENECDRAGFPREKRRFNPHLTIARLRQPGLAKDLIREHLENKFEPAEVKVSGLSIFESRLHPTGSIYQRVYNSKLNPGKK